MRDNREGKGKSNREGKDKAFESEWHGSLDEIEEALLRQTAIGDAEVAPDLSHRQIRTAALRPVDPPHSHQSSVTGWEECLADHLSMLA